MVFPIVQLFLVITSYIRERHRLTYHIVTSGIDQMSLQQGVCDKTDLENVSSNNLILFQPFPQVTKEKQGWLLLF